MVKSGRMGRRCRLLFALALATVAAALVCASLPSLLPDGELRGVRGQGSALRYRCGGGRRQTGLRRGRLAVRGGHVPIYSEWNANKSAPLWRMEAPEISSVYQVYAGPSSCYQPVFSQWNVRFFDAWYMWMSALTSLLTGNSPAVEGKRCTIPAG